jgi:hypothetical protein
MWRDWAGKLNLRQRSSTCFSKAMVLRHRPWTGAIEASEVARFSAASWRQARQGFVVEPAPVRHRRAAIDQQPLQVRAQLVLAHQAHAANPGTPGRGGGIGLQRAFDLPVLELVQLQRQEHRVGGDGGLAGAQVAFELGPRRVVAGGRGGQAGVGGRRAEQVGEPLGQGHGLDDQQAQPLGVGAGGHEGALQLHQFVDGGAGGLQVGFDGRVAHAMVEIRQAPLRGVCGQRLGGGDMHGHGRRMNPLGPAINAESRLGVGDRFRLGHC